MHVNYVDFAQILILYDIFEFMDMIKAFFDFEFKLLGQKACLTRV